LETAARWHSLKFSVGFVSMKKWTRIGIAGAIIAAIFALVLFWRRPPDPIMRGRPASAWVLDLLSSDYKVRGEAHAALLQLGAVGVPQIRILLEKTNPHWQCYRYVDRVAAYFPFLQPNGPDAGLCRQRAAEMIGFLGPAGAGAVLDLTEALAYGEAKMEAERALVHVGDAAVPGLTTALHSRNPEIRADCARLLKEFPTRQNEFIGPLISALQDEQANPRKEAAATLGHLNDQQRGISPALLRTTKDPVAEVRAAACEGLGRVGKSSNEIRQALRTGMEDSMPIVRLEAAKALWLLTQDAATVVPVLSSVLPTQEGWQAAYALGNMGTAAAPAVPALIEVLKREKVPRAFRTPPSSSFALGQIGEPAIPALTKVLNDPQPAVRLAALLAFNFMGKHACGAVPELSRLLRDPESEVRNVAAITLAGAGAERAVIFTGLKECLHAEDIYLRSTAAALLREIAPEQEWAVAAE
jgi:HEAT repeat protein